MLKKWLMALCALCFVVPAWAADFQAGRDYTVLNQAVPTHDFDRVEVTEMFSYYCPHCAEFEPTLAAWRDKLPADVEMREIPVVFWKAWLPAARGFYVAKLLGKQKASHEAMFKAIHEQHQRMRTPEELADFYANYGIDKSEFIKQYGSFAVDMKMKEAESKAQAYQIQSVPSMVVNGKYLVTIEKAKNFKRMLQVVDALIAQERQKLK